MKLPDLLKITFRYLFHNTYTLFRVLDVLLYLLDTLFWLCIRVGIINYDIHYFNIYTHRITRKHDENIISIISIFHHFFNIIYYLYNYVYNVTKLIYYLYIKYVYLWTNKYVYLWKTVYFGLKLIVNI